MGLLQGLSIFPERCLNWVINSKRLIKLFTTDMRWPMKVPINGFGTTDLNERVTLCMNERVKSDLNALMVVN